MGQEKFDHLNAPALGGGDEGRLSGEEARGGGAGSLREPLFHQQGLFFVDVVEQKLSHLLGCRGRLGLWGIWAQGGWRHFAVVVVNCDENITKNRDGLLLA